jgi:hypothetical protein
MFLVLEGPLLFVSCDFSNKAQNPKSSTNTISKGEGSLVSIEDRRGKPKNEN